MDNKTEKVRSDYETLAEEWDRFISEYEQVVWDMTHRCDDYRKFQMIWAVKEVLQEFLFFKHGWTSDQFDAELEKRLVDKLEEKYT